MAAAEEDAPTEISGSGAKRSGPVSDPGAGSPVRFGRYQIEAELGRGGMGVVYRAFDPSLQRIVALKVMTGTVATAEDVKRFLREASAMARLRDPHIVPVHEVGEADGRPYYTMELVDGETLSATLQREHAIPPERAARIARDVSRALETVHEAGLVHRDVKPGNVLLCRTGGKERPLLSDFGLVGGADHTRLTRTGAVMGTPATVPGRARCERRSRSSIGSGSATAPGARSDRARPWPTSMVTGISTSWPDPTTRVSMRFQVGHVPACGDSRQAAGFGAAPPSSTSIATERSTASWARWISTSTPSPAAPARFSGRIAPPTASLTGSDWPTSTATARRIASSVRSTGGSMPRAVPRGADCGPGRSAVKSGAAPR